MNRFVTFLAAVTVGVAPAVVSAQGYGPQPAAPQRVVVTGNKAPVVGDPNEVVCEKQKTLGSRIAVKKICQTRAEWALHRFNDRMELDKTQVQKGSCEGCP